MGDTFGKYELVKKIAKGGMAEVFLARQKDESSGSIKHVAIKRLFPHLTGEQEIVDLFLVEGRIASTLAHANVVPILDCGVIDEFLYLTMEYVHGRDLRSILEEGYSQDNFIPTELAASLGAQVAAGLHYAHTLTGEDGASLNIVHSDISPQNILVSVDGAVQICDFGVSKVEQLMSQTQAEQVKGKFSYMAPEQIESSQVDARSDVFALGVVLYETTTMTRLFRADNQFEALEKILYAGIEPPTTLRAGYPVELEKIVMRALERDPSARYQTAEAMQTELENWLVQNQASTSPVALARYMRGLFPVLSKPISDSVAETTGPMQVSEDVVLAVDGKKPAADEDKTVADEEFERPTAAADASMSQETKKKKDVTEMDEDDLDKALDFALGAPSEADVVIQRPMSEASEAGLATEPMKEAVEAPKPEPEPEPAEREYVDEEPTVISERAPEIAELDVAEPASTSQIVPLVASEPPAVVSAPAPAPAPVVAAAAPAAKPAPSSPAAPAGRSGNIPSAPPGSMKPPAAISAEGRARAAFGEGTPKMPSDLSLDELEDASGLSTKRNGMIVVGLFAFVLIAFILAYALSLDTTDSEMEREVERTQVDPSLLVTEVAKKLERVSATIETTPPDAYIVVDGLPVTVEGGKVGLVKGQKNEINVYAAGHKSARVYVDGVGSGSPLGVTLEPLEEVPADETADLNILTEPRGATVWVDGVEVGSSPTTVTGLWTGEEHHVYIESEGRFPYTGFISLVKKSENLVETKLAKRDSAKKNYVEVIFAAIPRGSVVQIEGEAESLGVTPFFKTRDRNTFITVSFEERDSVPMRRHAALEDVGTFELRPFLQPMKRERGTVTIYVEPMGPEIYVGNNAYGQGPAGNISLPEGSVNVVLDTPHGRQEVAVQVIPNTHTRYTLTHSQSGVKATKKD